MNTATRQAIDRYNRTEGRRQGLTGAAAAQASGIVIRGGAPAVLAALIAAGYPYRPRQAPAARPGPTTPPPPAAPRMRTWLDTHEAQRPPDELAGYGAPDRPIMPVTAAQRREAAKQLGLSRLPWEA
jgi:hypothetical protein